MKVTCNRRSGMSFSREAPEWQIILFEFDFKMLTKMWTGLKDAAKRLKSAFTLQKDLRPIEVTTPGEETVTYFIDYDTTTGEDVVKMHTNHLGIRYHHFVLGLRYIDANGNRLFLESGRLLKDSKIPHQLPQKQTKDQPAKPAVPMKFESRAVVLPENINDLPELTTMRLIYNQTKNDLVTDNKFDHLECPDPVVRQELDSLADEIDNRKVLEVDGIRRYLNKANQLRNFGAEYFAAYYATDQEHIPKDRQGKLCVLGIDSYGFTFTNPLQKNKQVAEITIPWSDVMHYDYNGSVFKITTFYKQDALGRLTQPPRAFDLLMTSKEKCRSFKRLAIRYDNLYRKLERGPTPLHQQLLKETERRLNEPKKWFDQYQELKKINAVAQEFIDAHTAILESNSPVFIPVE